MAFFVHAHHIIWFVRLFLDLVNSLNIHLFKTDTQTWSLIFFSSFYSTLQRLIPSTDVVQLTLTLKTTTVQVFKTSVTANNSPIQDYGHPDDYAPSTHKMTPGFKPFTGFFYTFYNTDISLRWTHTDSLRGVRIAES